VQDDNSCHYKQSMWLNLSICFVLLLCFRLMLQFSIHEEIPSLGSWVLKWVQETKGVATNHEPF